MDDKAKSRQYFNGHSSTGINRNGYWSRDYKATTAVLLDHGVTKSHQTCIVYQTFGSF